MGKLATMVSGLIVLGVMTGVAAASDQTKFDSKIRQFVVDANVLAPGQLSPKGVCVCAPTTPSDNGRNAPGFLLLFDGKVFCRDPGFGADGSLGNGGTLCDDFQVLGK